MEAPSRHEPVLDGALIGRTLDGRYAVQSRLAQGGMATVYRAWDNRLDRLVALKVIDPELARHPEYVARFIREAKSAARLSHPNIVAVYDQSGQPPLAYLAMEYVPGETLRELLGRRGRLSPREALEVLDAMLAGLAAAHRAGIVHRDVKPENVLLNAATLNSRQGSYASAVKVTDFGLARSVSTEGGTPGATLGSSLGATLPGGGLIGTVSYLAPELVAHGTCDARSDVYSAGIVLFELLCGRKPFTGGTPVEIARRHVTERVPPPSLLVPGLDPALDALVASATARDPGARPVDAAAYREQVRAVYANLPDSALNLGGYATVETTRPLPPEPTRRAEPTQHYVAPRTSARQSRVVDQAPRRRSLKGLIIFLVVLFLAAAAGIGAWLYGRVVFENTPNLVGLTRSQATTTLAGDGLKARIVEGYSDTVGVGEVASVSPSPGTPVKQGSVITLTVSKGRRATVPDVTGRTQDDATAALQGSGFTVAIATAQVSSDTVPKGSVVSYTPRGAVAPGSTVTLTLSSGARQVVVRDVTDMTVEDATAALQAQGFTVHTTRLLPFVDNVGRQSPSGGSSVDYGSTITLYIY
ncbi:Stk1 family PASTA domain-containing Ser/Thr kinase [Actinocrinis puniceicyclus]|uniref:non-specific serine/threonine protein kinase n=1 Tax=Actinocrinis puniceicyclus TaxID=977794 RepID=A0A8J8BBZ6_9ACTN|nr:Stk1 family PASTA domain-containing Ser/Thr kinase [Actinocrinis puniceicyclus]MBS2964582.1 Stk1 family PASTA domain-containing Ser/Thr kinase [Actinocrinis puniceicyclus]